MIFDIEHKAQHRCTIEFNTTIAQKTKGHEQRQCRWMNPKRTFELAFENTPCATNALSDFFIAQKGDYELFFWNWGVSGLDYKCFFEGDKLAQKMLHKNYSNTSLSLVTVDDGNILKNRYLTCSKDWSIQGSAEILGQKIVYTDGLSITQNEVLEIGKTYILEAFCNELTGSTPILSPQSAQGEEELRTMSSGINCIEFRASGENLTIEAQLGTSGEIYDLLLRKKHLPQAVLELEPKIEHTQEIIFNTLHDEDFSYQNNRRSLWEAPLRRWELNFNLSPQQARYLDTFFIAQKGRYKSFLFNYQGENFTVRFDEDMMEFQYFDLGYAQVKTPIIQVF